MGAQGGHKVRKGLHKHLESQPDQNGCWKGFCEGAFNRRNLKVPICMFLRSGIVCVIGTSIKSYRLKPAIVQTAATRAGVRSSCRQALRRSTTSVGHQAGLDRDAE